MNKMLAGFIAAVFLLALPLPAHAIRVQAVKSPGGITAWLAEDHTLPIISVRAAFRQAGAAYDAPKQQGLSNMVSNLLLEGAGKYPSLAFHEALEAHAIRLGFDANQDTFEASVETLSEQKSAAGELLRTSLQSPRFDADSVARIRAAILSELRQLEEDPGYAASRALAQAVFGTHPYGRPLRGDAASVQALQKKDFVQFVRQRFSRQNLVITAAGDITPAELGAWLDTTFGFLPATSALPPEIPEAVFPAAPSTQVIRRAIPQTVFAFAYPGVKRDNPDYIPAYVLNQILGGGDLTSRLSQEIREKRGLAYYVDMSLQPLQHGAVWAGQFATRGEAAMQALRVMQEEVAKLAKDGVSAQELQDAKDYLVGSFSLGLDSNRSLSAFLMTMRLYNLGIDYLDRREALLRGVTQAQLQAVARRLLTTTQLAVVIVGSPAPEAKPDSDRNLKTTPQPARDVSANHRPGF